MGREEGSGWGTHVYLWQIHFDIWQNQYNIVKLRADLLEKTLMWRKTEGRKRRELQSMRWLDSITDSMDICLSKLQEIVQDREAYCATIHGVTKSRTPLKDRTTTDLSSVQFSHSVLSNTLRPP